MYTICAVSYKRAPARPRTRGTQPIGPPGCPCSLRMVSHQQEQNCLALNNVSTNVLQSKGAIQPCPRCLSSQFELIGETSIQLTQKLRPCGLEEHRGCNALP